MCRQACKNFALVFLFITGTTFLRDLSLKQEINPHYSGDVVTLLNQFKNLAKGHCKASIDLELLRISQDFYETS